MDINKESTAKIMVCKCAKMNLIKPDHTIVSLRIKSCKRVLTRLQLDLQSYTGECLGKDNSSQWPQPHPLSSVCCYFLLTSEVVYLCVWAALFEWRKATEAGPALVARPSWNKVKEWPTKRQDGKSM